jgi:formylglycine-generating enzyme required for sulfatase activity
LRKLTDRDRKAGKLPEGYAYRLPTEAEWEYACRAGSETEYCFGDSADRLGEYAWYSSNSGKRTHPVAQKQPNAWGLSDMHGNVWEWCQDWYGESYYRSSPTEDPQGPASGKYRVLRGGSWDNASADCRSAGRYWNSPEIRITNGGLRVVASPRP